MELDEAIRELIARDVKFTEPKRLERLIFNGTRKRFSISANRIIISANIVKLIRKEVKDEELAVFIHKILLEVDINVWLRILANEVFQHLYRIYE